MEWQQGDALSFPSFYNSARRCGRVRQNSIGQSKFRTHRKCTPHTCSNNPIWHVFGTREVNCAVWAGGPSTVSRMPGIRENLAALTHGAAEIHRERHANCCSGEGAAIWSNFDCRKIRE